MKSILLFLIACADFATAAPLDQPALDALLAQIAARRAGKAVEADFVESKTLPMMREPVVERGTIAFEPPDKFLRRTENGTISVSDGRVLWLYYPTFQQAEKYPLGTPHGPGEFFRLLAATVRLDDLAKEFRVAGETTPDGHLLTLIPRSAGIRRMLQSIVLELDPSLRLRRSVITSKEGDRTETTYSNERTMPAGRAVFQFEPPKGTTVVAPLG